MRSLTRLIAAAALGVVMTTPVQAASVSYFLTNSDILPDGQNYIQVTISDGLNGAIDFTVQALQPLLDLAGPRFGISQFAFNALPGVSTTPANIDFLPSPGWSKGQNQFMTAFGRYDFRVRARGARASTDDTLTFSITGVDLDTVTSYVDLALGSKLGPSLFSAAVRGLQIDEICGPSTGPSAFRRSGYGGGGNKCEGTLAYFGGGDAQAIPAPPAIWLLATGVVAVAARRLRKAA